MRSITLAAPLLIGCLLAACHLMRQSPGPAPEDSRGAGATAIFVSRRKWHIDVGFAVSDLRAPLKSLTGQIPGAKYLFFGFGDRHYLLAKSRNTSTMLGALWPGAGLLLITALDNTPAEAFGAAEVIELKVSAAQALAAQAFIARSFAPAESTAPPLSATPYAPGPYEGSLYYDAVPRYSAFHTCNTWAAEALKAAGQPVHSTLILFAGQLWPQVQRAAAELAKPDAAGASMPP